MIPSLEKSVENRRLLVVDDEPRYLKAMVIGLRLEGIDASGASSGQAALQILAEEPFCAVVIDLMMPNMNGIQLAREIRARFPHVLTVLMSAYHLSPAQLLKADTGIVGFVPKPCSFGNLINFIQEKLGTRRTQELSCPDMGAAQFESPIDIANFDCT